ncbi:MAG: N-acetylglucosamine-6-phosphate deacetylase [Chloroflexia bacterium]
MLYISPKAIFAPGRLPSDTAVLTDGDRIAAVGPAAAVPCPTGATRLPAGDLLLAPGFIDLQINGAFGLDFTADPSTIWEVGARLPQYGVTAFLPTIISSPLNTIAAAQEVLRQGPPPGYSGATPLGLHLEGPFLNPEKRGAHNPAHLRTPSLHDIEGWSPDQGVRLVTLAPELPGALDVVRELVSRGVVISAGHSIATFDQARAGLQAGITYGTHLFNAMPPLNHREPGLPGALLADPSVTVGVIPDGIHLHPSLVSLVLAAKGPGHLNLVTDAMAALSMPPGTYLLGDHQVITDGESVRLPNGTLAGSVLSLDEAVRNLVQFTGCRRNHAIITVTLTPASLLGLGLSYGRIGLYCRADLTLLDSQLHVVATIVDGEIAYSTLN